MYFYTALLTEHNIVPNKTDRNAETTTTTEISQITDTGTLDGVN